MPGTVRMEDLTVLGKRLTLRGFASMAIYRMAVLTLKEDSQDELANLTKLLSDPYHNADRITKAHKRASAIPHREVSDEETL